VHAAGELAAPVETLEVPRDGLARFQLPGAAFGVDRIAVDDRSRLVVRLVVPQTRTGLQIERRHTPADLRRELEEVVLNGLIVHQQNAVLVADG
jgi:hypothetical protein